MSMSLSSAAHKVNKSLRLVRIWSPWWNEYIANCDFSYTTDPSVESTMGLSNLIMVVNTDFLARNSLMDIAVSLEFSLQQSLRNMDSRAEQYLTDHPGTRADVIAVAQAMEINSDMSRKFSSVTDMQWETIAKASIDEKYTEAFGAENPPELPQGSVLPGDFGFEDGLVAEKYIAMLVEKNRQEEEEFLNQEEAPGEDDPQPEGGDAQEGNGGEGGDQENTPGKQQGESTPGDAGKPGNPVSAEEGLPDSPSNQGDSPESTPESPQEPHREPGSPQGGNDTKEASGKPSGAYNSPGNEDNEDQQESPSTHHDLPQESPGDTPAGNPQDQQGGNQGEPLENDTLEDTQSPDGASGGSQKPRSSQTPDGSHTPGEKDDLSTLEGSIAESMDTTEDRVPTTEKHSVVPEVDPGETPQENPHGSTQQPNGDHQGYTPDSDLGDGGVSAIEAGLADQFDNSPQASDGDHERIQEQFKHILDRMPGEITSSNMTIPSFNTPGSATGVDRDEKKTIDKQVAKDIKEYSDSVPTTGGFSTGEDFIKWSGDTLRASTVPWQQVFRRVLGNFISRAQMSGVSDLSYAKQNPNQQPDMPIMMGFITYPPEVTVLIDASPSMVKDKKDTMSEFVGMSQKIMMQYSQPIVMAAADSNIQYVAYSTSPARNIMNNVGKTFSGSSAEFGKTVQRTAQKGVSFRGRHYPKPDILVIFTDCLFPWPLENNNKLPLSYANVIVASTRSFEEIERFLPKWVKKNRNFVHINS